MARTLVDSRVSYREQRLKLIEQKRYWTALNEGEHLGYYRGKLVGKWIARYRRPGSKAGYQLTTLGEADDFSDADGEIVLNYKQAHDAARKWFLELDLNGGRKSGSFTVSDAMDDYILGFQGKDLTNTRRRIDAIIRPDLGHFEFSKLTAKIIKDWLTEVANRPAMLRTAKGAEQNYRETADNDEARRRRKASANRIFAILKAGLNVAYREGKTHSDDAWRRVKPFQNVDRPKMRYLSDEESRRLVNACESKFRPMVQAALLTGARYSELAGLEARDFDRLSQTIWLRETKSGVSRAVYLEDEGMELFEQATAGKLTIEPIFPRPDGDKWKASQQTRLLADACKRAKLERTGFHDLRRTYGARLALRGVPMTVIAEALGHSDERITRRHYAHLSKSYVANTVRKAVAGLGVVSRSNVTRLAQR